LSAQLFIYETAVPVSSGFMAVNRERLKKLAQDALAQLAATDEVELIYLHLQSMRNFNLMRERLA
jgi:hypothetical protein